MSDILLTYRLKDDQILSPATRIIFGHIEGSNRQICLKMWLPCNNGLYDTEDGSRRIDYLLEGLEFNRRFAQNVYLGVASVEELSEEDSNEDTKKIRLGPVIENPNRNQLVPELQYALVMKRLKEDWHLEHQLRPDKIGTKTGMEFLAREIAWMHLQLITSLEGIGHAGTIWDKLTLNKHLFAEALNKLKDQNIKRYKLISNTLTEAYAAYTELFKQRYNEGYIKRCHGDLKSTNLWVRPKRKKFPQQLLALDCVDFRPEFCHIDTLSDVAMLAIDIEQHLINWPEEGANTLQGQELTQHFLNTYLQNVQEHSEVALPLLEYYMTEKSMICAYMSILFDDLPQLGRSYLNVALIHTKKLKRLLGFPRS